MINAIPKGKEL